MEQAQDGGIMGDQKDFEEFLQDMQDRDKQMLQDRILQDFEKFMKRKKKNDIARRCYETTCKRIKPIRV